MKEHHFNISKIAEIMTFDQFKEIDRVYTEYLEREFPNAPYPTPLEHRLKSPSPANRLTNAIVKYLLWSGNFAERINTTGMYRNGRWTTGGGTPGSADISAIINGMTVKIEVKWGKDKQSEAQKVYQNNIELAGAKYWLVRNMTDFFNNLKTL